MILPFLWEAWVLAAPGRKQGRRWGDGGRTGVGGRVAEPPAPWKAGRAERQADSPLLRSVPHWPLTAHVRVRCFS